MPVVARTGFFLDRHPGIIGHLLPQAGEGIEERCFASVGIAHQGKGAWRTHDY